MAKKKDASPADKLQKETDNLVRQGDRTKKQIDKTVQAADELVSKAEKHKREDVNQTAARILRDATKQ